MVLVLSQVIGVTRHIDYFISITCINQVVWLILADSPKHKQHEPLYLTLLIEQLGYSGFCCTPNMNVPWLPVYQASVSRDSVTPNMAVTTNIT